MSRHRSSVIGTALASLAAAGLVLTGCTPGASNNAAPNVASSGGAASTNVAKLGKVDLHILDYFTGGVDNAWMKSVVSAFEKKYPNVTVSRQSMGWGDVMQALPLKMKRNNPPDIVPANNGWQSLGTLVQGGLVLNLDNYAKSAVFPSAASNAFTFAGKYVQSDTLRNGFGYWLKFGGKTTFSILVSERTADTIPVTSMWNASSACASFSPPHPTYGWSGASSSTCASSATAVPALVIGLPSTVICPARMSARARSREGASPLSTAS